MTACSNMTPGSEKERSRSPAPAPPTITRRPAGRADDIRSSLWDWLPAVLLLFAAISAGRGLPPWAFMWALAFALFFGGKWLTWRRARRQAKGASPARNGGYLLAWPGMDARTFLDPNHVAAAPSSLAPLAPLLKLALGCCLLWLVGPLLSSHPPWLRGWCGMIGLILILHFGLFHLLALLWQRAGIAAEPIMQAPTRATSLADFWGRRWNRGFHQLVGDLLYWRCARRYGARAATLAAFLVSGLVHELVISVPARAGFGGPTLYFLLQGVGLLVERSRKGRRAGLGAGVRGWCWTLLFTVGPVGMVFHRAFVDVVVIPFLRVIEAA